MYNPMDLTGKRILVTGASSGIGRTCAVILSKLGAEILLVSRNQARLEETRQMMVRSEIHTVLPFDLSVIDDVGSILKCYDFKVNKLSGLVHAAGITGAIPLGDTTPKIMAEILGVNFLSYIELCRVLVKRFYTLDGSSFVAISSAASQSAWKGGVAYCSSKAALDSATRVLALEFAGRRIRFNTVVPSYIRTKMVDDTVESGVDLQSILSKRQPLGLGEPEDVAHAIAYLMSDAARFVTGIGLAVDGGWLAE